jgi:CBS domain-containing protein
MKTLIKAIPALISYGEREALNLSGVSLALCQSLYRKPGNMDTTLREILDKKPAELVTVPPEATVSAAVRSMVSGGVGCVLVMDEAYLQGLFTERDLMCRVVDRHLDPEQTLVSEVMTREVVSISPRATVGEAMSLCTTRRLRHLPVYENERLLGIVSTGDLTKAAVSDKEHTIEDLIRYINGGMPA